MKIGILETGDVHPDLRAVHGDYSAMFRALLSDADPLLTFATVRVVGGEMPADPAQADAWLVTGSRHGIYDELPWIGPLKVFLRDCVAAGVPVVGICFGHQILAEALGGRAAKSDGGWVLGVQDYELVARPGWMTHVPDRFAVGAIHQDQVVALPPDATILARSDRCPIAAAAYGDPERPGALSLQPHPEFSAAFLGDLLELRRAAFPADRAATARDSLSRAVHSPDWARLIVDYLRRVVPSRAAA